jgi:hypothetical protein
MKGLMYAANRLNKRCSAPKQDTGTHQGCPTNLLTMKNSGPYSTLPLLRIPAVSTNRYVALPRCSRASTASRVVPAMSDTMERSSPSNLYDSLCIYSILAHHVLNHAYHNLHTVIAIYV